MATETKGNPFFAVEMLNSLKDMGAIVVDQAKNELVFNESMIGAQAHIVPSSVKSMITEKIDKLPPQEALMLKVASVFQGDFYRAALETLFEEEKGDMETFEQTLTALEEK